MMRRGWEARLRALEQSEPSEPEIQKTLVPAWLMEKWKADGVRFDAAGRIDRESLLGLTGCGMSEAGRCTQLS